jgi:MYXO-CTERM domain-containing protein
MVANATPPIRGTGDPGATVVITIDGMVVGMTTVGADGTWSFTPTMPLSVGSHTATATSTDHLGGMGTATTTFTVTTDTFVRIDSPADGSTITSGSPVISGHGHPGDTIVVTVDGMVIGMTTVAADGTWSVPTTTTLADGMHTASATATGSGGAMATATSSFRVMRTMGDGGMGDAGTGDAGVRDGGLRDGSVGDGSVRDGGAGGPGGFAGGACVCSTPGATGARSPLGALALLGVIGLAIARRRRARAAAVLLALAALLVPAAGEAQSGGFTLDQYRATETQNDGFAVSRPDDLGHLNLGARLVLDYAHNPLVYETRVGDMSTQSTAIVAHQLVGTVGLALGLFDRVVIYGGLPVSLVNTGASAVGFPSADGTMVGDPYLGVRVRLFGERTDLFALAIQLTGTAPLANLVDAHERFTGEQTFAFLPRLNGEFRLLDGQLRIGLNLGGRFRQETTLQPNLVVGQELTYGVGVTYSVVPNVLDLMVEGYGSTAFDHFFAREWTPFEVLGGGRVHPMCDLSIGLAAGGGLTRGYGAPNFRGILDVGWAWDARCHTEPVVAEPEPEPEAPVPGDTDHDGILDPSDACPTEPEDVDTFQDDDGCPDPDNDGDGVLDVNDGAPMEPEDRDGWQDEDGVPDPDNDGDGVPDTSDGAPNDPEDRDGFQDEDGVPDPDNDQDTVPDATDECPLAPGRPEDHGCPQSVRLDTETGQIIILQRVEFATNRDVILERSFPILQEVYAVLQANPQLTRIRIEGHTDDRGRDDRNLDLSRRRAASVMRWLVEHGVDAGRLAGAGCGELHPIDTNATTDGRQANRRVEFHIVEPAPPDGARQLEGCVEVTGL